MEKGEKTSQKSKVITRTPTRGTMMEVTPNAKKSSEREQDPAKKSKQEWKKESFKFCGDGACVPAPTNKGTPIDAVAQHRKSRGTGNNTPNKAEGRE